MPYHVKDGGVWKEGQAKWVKDGGVWKEVQDGWIKDAGIWKPHYSAVQPYVDSFESWPNGTTGALPEGWEEPEPAQTIGIGPNRSTDPSGVTDGVYCCFVKNTDNTIGRIGTIGYDGNAIDVAGKAYKTVSIDGFIYAPEDYSYVVMAVTCYYQYSTNTWLKEDFNLYYGYNQNINNENTTLTLDLSAQTYGEMTEEDPNFTYDQIDRIRIDLFTVAQSGGTCEVYWDNLRFEK